MKNDGQTRSRKKRKNSNGNLFLFKKKVGQKRVFNKVYGTKLKKWEKYFTYLKNVKFMHKLSFCLSVFLTQMLPFTVKIDITELSILQYIFSFPNFPLDEQSIFVKYFN